MCTRQGKVQIHRASPAECEPAGRNWLAKEQFILLPRTGSPRRTRGTLWEASKGFNSEKDSARRARGFVLRGGKIGHASEEVLSPLCPDAPAAPSAAAAFQLVPERCYLPWRSAQNSCCFESGPSHRQHSHAAARPHHGLQIWRL